MKQAAVQAVAFAAGRSTAPKGAASLKRHGLGGGRARRAAIYGPEGGRLIEARAHPRGGAWPATIYGPEGGRLIEAQSASRCRCRMQVIYGPEGGRLIEAPSSPGRTTAARARSTAPKGAASLKPDWLDPPAPCHRCDLRPRRGPPH